MSEKYLVGIDNGGSEIKCAVFSLDGREVAVASRRLPIEVPHPSWSERDSLEVWEKNAEAIAEALELAGITGADVAGVGLTGYGNGFCLVDAEGNPTYKAIVSTDERANDICDEFAETGVERAIYPMTCQSTWAAQPIALLAWFKRYNPAALEASRWVLGIKDWIRFKLTGEFTTEITEASSTCLCNLHTRAFDPAIFEAAGIADCFEKMPRIIESVESGGTVTAEAAAATGLAEGTPVVGGFFDIDACEFASGVADTETLCLIAGTWSINERLATTANTDYDKNKNTVTLGYRPGFFNVEESWPTSASNFDWFVANFLERDRPGISRGEIYAECNAAVGALDPGDSHVVFVPYLYGASYPSGADACFLGLSSYTAREHMILAVYEGVCFSTLWNVHQLVGEDLAGRRVRLSGGVAKSHEWTQIMADVLGVPVETLANTELGCQGAAMAAGVAAGVYASYDDAIARSVRVGEVVEPRPEYVGLYREKFAAYERALEALNVFGGKE